MADPYPELFDPGRSADYASILEKIRRENPIFYMERDEFSAWVITRHEHVVALLRDKRLGVPSLATRISGFSDDQRRQLEPMQEFIRNNLGRTRERRRALRTKTKQIFKPSSVERLRPRMCEVIEQLLSDVDTRATVDLVSSLSYPMPAIVMAELLGAPDEDQGRFIDWSKALIDFHRSYDFESMLATQAGVVELLDYCAALIESRRGAKAQGDAMVDLFARLLDEGRSEIGELSASCATFLMAGHENTSHLIANIFSYLFSNSDQLAAVMRDLSRIPKLIHETLRYNGVVPFLTREVSEPFTFEGRPFEQGQLISLSLFSANRDDAVFHNADEFDIENPRARHHLGFGHGVNQCRGSHLAMVESEEILKTLLTRFPPHDASRRRNGNPLPTHAPPLHHPLRGRTRPLQLRALNCHEPCEAPIAGLV
jgi:cytochrome P450